MIRNAIRKHVTAILFGIMTLASSPTLFQAGCTDYGYGGTYFADPLQASYIMSYNNDRFLDAVDAWDVAEFW